MLVGTEIKSIRENKASISDAHCVFIQNELYVKNLHISEYNNGGYANHEVKRNRKLLEVGFSGLCVYCLDQLNDKPRHSSSYLIFALIS